MDKSIIHSLEREITKIKNLETEREEDKKRIVDIISNSVINLSDSISDVQASLEELKESYQKVRAQATNAKMDRGRLADLEKMFLSLRFVQCSCSRKITKSLPPPLTKNLKL